MDNEYTCNKCGKKAVYQRFGVHWCMKHGGEETRRRTDPPAPSSRFRKGLSWGIPIIVVIIIGIVTVWATLEPNQSDSIYVDNSGEDNTSIIGDGNILASGLSEKQFNELNSNILELINQNNIGEESELTSEILISTEQVQLIDELIQERNGLQKKLIEQGKVIDITITQLLKEGNVFYYANEFSKALEIFDFVLSIDSDNFIAMNNIGSTLILQNQYPEAISVFDEALKINPEYIHALNGKGVALMQMNQYSDAIISFDKVLKLEPEHIPSLNNKGGALGKMEEYENSIIYFDKVLKLEPEHIFSLENKALSLNELGAIQSILGNQDDAIKFYDQALELVPTYSIAYHNKGTSLLLLHEYDDALSNFNLALKYDPNNINAQNEKEKVLELLKENQTE